MSYVSRFCTACVPDFTPLGGSRPDAAVVACVAVWKEEEEAEEDVVLPPDVLDTLAHCQTHGGPPGPGGALQMSHRHHSTPHQRGGGRASTQGNNCHYAGERAVGDNGVGGGRPGNAGPLHRWKEAAAVERIGTDDLWADIAAEDR